MRLVVSLRLLDGLALITLAVQSLGLLVVVRALLRWHQLTRRSANEPCVRLATRLPIWPSWLILSPLLVPVVVGIVMGNPTSFTLHNCQDGLRLLIKAADLMLGSIAGSVAILVLTELGMRRLSPTLNKNGQCLLDEVTAKSSSRFGQYGWAREWLVLCLLAIVPLLVGTHLFGRTILDSLADAPLILPTIRAAWIASDKATQSLSRSAWVSAVFFLAFTAVALRAAARTGPSVWRRPLWGQALLSALFLLGAIFIARWTSPLAAENTSPWPSQGASADRSFLRTPASGSLFKTLQGPCPSPYLSAPAIEILSPSLIQDPTRSFPVRVDGATQASNSAKLRDDLASAARNAELLSYESPHQLNVFADPRSSLSDLAAIATIAHAVGFLQISLVCGTGELANRPLLGVQKRILASAINMDMVSADRTRSDDIISIGAFRTVGDLAAHVARDSDKFRRKALLIGNSEGQ